MKKTFLILTFAVSFLLAYFSFVQWSVPPENTTSGTEISEVTNDTPSSYEDSARYFPLKIGNRFYYKYKYTYHHYDTTRYDSSYFAMKITDTVRVNGKLYYKMKLPSAYYSNNSDTLVRYDADSGYIKVYDPVFQSCSYEHYYFKLAAVLHEVCTGSCISFPLICYSNKDTTAFGLQKKVKVLYNNWGGTLQSYMKAIFIKDIGLTNYYYQYAILSSELFYIYEFNLTGAYVNGIKYGDTNTVGVKPIGTSVPDKYALYQNYPNPFNPSTNIRYQITPLNPPFDKGGTGGFVTLKVYNILGKEVATPVNEKQSPGTYEVTWDASQFPSGVYFYKLTSGDFTETKKMLLVK